MPINVNFADARIISSFAVLGLAILMFVFSLSSHVRPCEIVITGESVAISNCKVDSSLTAFIESIKLLNNCLN